jgi:hypothetical protein
MATATDDLTAREKAATAVLVAAAAAAGVDVAAVADALAHRNVDALVAAVDWVAWREALAGYEPILVAEYLSTVTATLDGFEWGATFDPTGMARTWAYTHAGELVTAIDGPTRQAVRQIVVEAIGRGDSIDRTATAIKTVVGLHPRYALAVDRYRQRLEAEGVRFGRVEQQVGRYRRKLLRSRAESIARYEVQDAMNRGRYQVWQEGIANRALPTTSQKAWSATSGACPICQGLDGETVGVNEPFSDGRLMPPDHVRCRCSAVLV